MADNAALYRSPAGHAALMAWYDAALARLALPYEVRWLPTRLGATHALAAGDPGAPPLVLLHGWNGNAAMWAEQLAPFAAQYRVYAPDMIGQAGRSAPTRPPVGGPAYAEWLADVLDALGLERAPLVGISGGAWLILKFATVAAQRIERAALMSAAGLTRVRPAFLLRVLPAMLLSPRLATRQFVRIVTPPGLPVRPEEAELFGLLIGAFRSQPAPPPLGDAELRKLRAPALLLMGQYEAIFDPAAALARARALLPDLRAAEIVPNAGHGMVSEQPDLVNARIMRFLREGV